MKKLKDDIFGVLSCEYIFEDKNEFWMKKLNLGRPIEPIGTNWGMDFNRPLFGKNHKWRLKVCSTDWSEIISGAGGKEGEFEKVQYSSWEAFMKTPPETLDTMLEPAILEFYNTCVRTTDYGHEGFKSAKHFSEICEYLTSPVLSLPRLSSNLDAESIFFITIKCEFDDHGFGARFENERLTESGQGGSDYSI